MFRRLLLTLGLGFAIAPAVLCGARAQDASELVVRLNRLENVSRQLSGQIETLQYENRQLKEQLRKFQEDVEFRFQEGKGSAAAPARKAPAPAAAPPSAAPYGTNPGEGRPGKRSDAFDPEQNPNAPGAPKPLGTTQPSLPLPTGAMAEAETPLRRSVPPTVVEAEADASEDGDLPPPGFGSPVDLSPPPSRTGSIAPVEAPVGSASIAATGSGDAQADFEAAYALIRERQYEQAEMSLRQFIQSHPRDRLVPKATYWLGESYLQRSRSREAAEQFLKVSTDYANSPVAPEAMLKLGTSLHALGAKAQACATLAEVERKFPSANAIVRQGVEREQKRARCAA
ncbi:tol-pal system protein YbgF [Methylorubrum extorquens]|uniref:Cell division coordinator CpoB n=1 Tax=Methylorubrum extorquens TaxID=408 RepID=A0AAX3WMS9_METEX|nr:MULTISPECIES: tol-pal system protein YbgF [Methylobacteriaceae]KQQ12453.1 tol-pal system protein [Methylobacterium sp. Leaf122]WHQ72855.1 tol-pal system protein YbgF [Methylorubrum extorquens]